MRAGSKPFPTRPGPSLSFADVTGCQPRLQRRASAERPAPAASSDAASQRRRHRIPRLRRSSKAWQARIQADRAQRTGGSAVIMIQSSSMIHIDEQIIDHRSSNTGALHTSARPGRATRARPADTRHAQSRRAGRHLRREYPLSEQSRGVLRHPRPDARMRRTCSWISDIAKPCRCCSNRHRPARASSCATCRRAMTKRCSTASREIGVSTVGFEAAHVSVAKHDWWQRTSEARALDRRVAGDGAEWSRKRGL